MLTKHDEQRVRKVAREEINEAVEVLINPQFDDVRSDIRRLEVLFEDFDSKLDGIAELVTTTVETRRDVVDLKDRVQRLEDRTV